MEETRERGVPGAFYGGRRPEAAGHRSPRRYNKFSARKSSRGSSKLQLPKEVTNFRRPFRRLMSIFHSRQAKNSLSNRNDLAFSSSSIAAVSFSSHLSSAAKTAAPNT